MRRMLQARGGPIVLVVGLCWLLASVAGCTGSEPAPAPTRLHPGTAATPTTTTPSGDPTEVAAVAAIAAVKRLYADFALMTKTGSSKAYRADFTRTCSACEANARLIDKLTAKHQRLVGRGFVVSTLKPVWNRPDLIIVQGRLSHGAFTIQRGTTSVGRLEPLPLTAFTWHVVPVNGDWLVGSAEALK